MPPRPTHLWKRRAAPLLWWLLVLAVTAPAWLQWLRPDLDLWEVDDSKNHLIRLYHLEWLIAHDAWYPRWVPEMLAGYGYPLFIYYAPGFYYVALLLKQVLRLDLWDAFRSAGVLAAALGAAGCYACVAGVWRRPAAGVLAAVAVAYAPYVFQTNLYKRGDLPEALGLALIPWLLLALWRAWHAPTRQAATRWTAAAALLGAAELLTHNLTALLTAFVAAAWVLYLLLRHVRPIGVARVTAAGAAALGLSAFFWLPAVAEATAVQLEWLREGNLDYRGWLLDLQGATEKLRVPELRQTRTGPIDLHLRYPHQLVATPKLSLGQAGLAVLCLVALAVAVLRRAASALAILPLLAVALFCWFLTFEASIPLWEAIPGLPVFQFPWRFLGPLGVCLALAAGGAAAVLLDAVEQRAALAGRRAAYAAVALLAAGIAVNGQGTHDDLPLRPGVPRIVDGRTVVQDEDRDIRGMGTTSGREFLPRDLHIATYTAGFPRGKSVLEKMYPEAEWSGGLLYPFAGRVRLLGWRAEPLRLTFRIANDEPSPAQVAVHQARFPGWRAWLDGRPAPIGVAPRVEEQGASPGFMVLDVPPGEHTYALAFGPTAPRMVGMLLTLAAVIVGGAAVVFGAYPSPFPSPARGGGTLRATGLARMVLPSLETRAALTINALVVVATAYLTWRGLSPAFGRFASLPLPHAGTQDGAWAAPDLKSHQQGLVVNIAEAARGGGAAVLAPTGPTLGPDKYADLRWLTVTDAEAPERGPAATSTRSWLYTHPTTDVSVDVRLPAGRQTWFQASLALDPRVWREDYGDGVRFQALVAPRGGATDVALDVTLNPRGVPAHRRWVPVEADLSRWAGRDVRLTLRSLPRDELSFDWAGWANPVVYVRESARVREPVKPPG
jgi:hypothetical protein